ncbi:tyrosine-protein kinase receptor UFO-like isoform X2 [Halichondria panicea]|uniref:tyrosine-protein kinase receptor UFO-like isoform X2 n=1 Tax=Halichondria panicea TaxID=6063 RepID=UPI00312BBA79
MIMVSPCICACICYARMRRYKKKRSRVSTIRMRKLSDWSNLMDYQMREIVKYVPESMRILPSSNLKLQDAVGHLIKITSKSSSLITLVCFHYSRSLWDRVQGTINGLEQHCHEGCGFEDGLFTQSDIQSMVSEITKMQEFHHPHVMPLIGVCLDAGPGVSIVMPYMTNGSLLDYMKKERSTLELAEGEDSEKVLAVRKLLLKMCHQITLGMAYLAQHKFIHRDLAARNCMLDSNGDLKVGDFGLAEDTYAQGYFRQGETEGVKLPYKWLAIESLNDAIFCEKTDVWSYGMTVLEVFSSGRTPYPGVDPMSLVTLLREGKRLEPPQNIACTTEMISLMTSCWYEDSEERPSFDELAAELEKVLSTMVGYVELNMELVSITEDEHKQKKLAEAATEEVAMEENAAYCMVKSRRTSNYGDQSR